MDRARAFGVLLEDDVEDRGTTRCGTAELTAVVAEKWQHIVVEPWHLRYVEDCLPAAVFEESIVVAVC